MRIVTLKGELNETIKETLKYLRWEMDRVKRGALRVHFKEWHGTRRYLSLVGEGRHDRFKSICKVLKIKYVEGNDARFGGVCGDYIELQRRDAKRLLEKINKIVEQRKDVEIY